MSQHTLHSSRVRLRYTRAWLALTESPVLKAIDCDQEGSEERIDGWGCFDTITQKQAVKWRGPALRNERDGQKGTLKGDRFSFKHALIEAGRAASVQEFDETLT
jgi:hypothetical protein